MATAHTRKVLRVGYPSFTAVRDRGRFCDSKSVARGLIFRTTTYKTTVRACALETSTFFRKHNKMVLLPSRGFRALPHALARAANTRRGLGHPRRRRRDATRKRARPTSRLLPTPASRARATPVLPLPHFHSRAVPGQHGGGVPLVADAERELSDSALRAPPSDTLRQEPTSAGGTRLTTVPTPLCCHAATPVPSHVTTTVQLIPVHAVLSIPPEDQPREHDGAQERAPDGLQGGRALHGRGQDQRKDRQRRDGGCRLPPERCGV